MINLTCSYCRLFGCAQVTKGLLDDTNTTPGANLNAFRLLKKHNEGLAELPFEIKEDKKVPIEFPKNFLPNAAQADTLALLMFGKVAS